MTYAAYLRIYEPVAAFHEPDRSRWAAYAASAARPRRRDSLAAEQAEALSRVITAPRIVVPDQESQHAYVRRTGGVTYICPWQTRLRWLRSYRRLLADPGSALSGLIPAGPEHAPPARTDAAAPEPPARLHILARAWAVPLAWFVPFAGAERWLALGPGTRPSAAPQTASVTRALLYTTPMARARRRVARGLAALRELDPQTASPDWDPAGDEDELGEVSRWLEGFHPYSLVELDYGGLVQLLSDDALSRDQSAAEIRAAIDGVARGQHELAVAMYQRAHSRWRAMAEYEMAN